MIAEQAGSGNQEPLSRPIGTDLAGPTACGGPTGADFVWAGHISPPVIPDAPPSFRLLPGCSTQSIDQPQDFLKQIAGHGDIRRLERDMATMADNLGADLDRP